MPSLAEYRKKIRGIKSTRQITKAMKMVSGARFARAQRSVLEARKYLAEATRLMDAVAGHEGGYPREVARFFAGKTSSDVKGVGLVAVSGDKGLCGSFNSNVIRECERFFATRGTSGLQFFTIGNKANDFYKRRSITIAQSWTGIFKDLDFSIAEKTAREIMSAYISKNLGEVSVIYNRFRSIIKQEVVVERLLPIEIPAPVKIHGYAPDFLLEPQRDELLPTVVPAYLCARIYQILRESQVAELAARMTAMENATRNAGELIDSITLEMNKLRQSTITRELIEIVGTNEVVK